MKPRTIRLRQNSPEWHAFRAVHIGSSEAPVIVGESPYRSPLDLYVEKTTGVQIEPDAETAHRFAIGHAMEPIALAMYAERTGRKLRKGRVLESRDDPRLSASLDGEAEGRIVEAKWTTSRRMDDEIPGDVAVQVTHQMAVSGLPVADVAVLTPRGFTIHEMPFDRGFWDSIYSHELAFWGRVIVRDPPPPDASEASRAALAHLYPEDRAPMLTADAEMATLVRLILDGRERLGLLENELDGWRNTLRFLIGEAEGVEGPGFRVIYRKAKDSTRVAWQEYAGSLRALIADGAPGLVKSADAMRGIYTAVQPGPRRLVVNRED